MPYPVPSCGSLAARLCCYPVPCADLAYAATPSCYAEFRTEVGYGATRAYYAAGLFPTRYWYWPTP
eukprot:819770-Rhodomonas_salina.2